MTLGQALDEAAARLDNPTGRIDAETLLRHQLGISRTELFRHLDQPLGADDAKRYLEVIERLKSDEPLQYLTGHIEFYGMEFYVNSSVLIPRPETELLAEKTIEIARTYDSPVIADVGCGSGAVAVSLAKHVPRSTTLALDISSAALELTRRNAACHECGNIEFIESDLLEGVTNRHLDIVCANLPYVPSAEAKSNRFEPQLALDGGGNGLDVIQRLVKQVAERRDKPDWLLLEFGTGQAAAVKAIIEKFLPSSQTEIFLDLIPLERVSVTRLTTI